MYYLLASRLGQISTFFNVGIADVYTPHEFLYWTKDLEGVSFESSSSLQVDDVMDEKDEDDPDLTWTSAMSTKG